MVPARVYILNGPGKFQIMTCCFDGKEVVFETNPFPPGSGNMTGVNKIRIQYVGVQPKENDWGDLFLTNFPVVTGFKTNGDIVVKPMGKLRGFYTTESVKPGGSRGWLEFEPDVSPSSP